MLDALKPLADAIYDVVGSQDLALLLPVITLAVFAVLILPFRGKTVSLTLGVLGSIVSAFLFITLVTYDATWRVETYNGLLVFDAFSIIFSLIVLMVAIFVLTSSTLFSGEQTEYISLFLISIVGAILVVLAGDLVTLFVAWELMSFPTYVLAAIGQKKEAVEGASKYLVLGLLSSMLMVFAIALTYGVSGTTSIAEYATFLETELHSEMEPVALLTLILFIVAFGFKIGIVPFHMWIPDCYHGAEGTVAAYLAGGTKKAGVSALLRILLGAFVFMKMDWTWMVIVLAVITMFLGNFLALTQRNLARLLAYSSIAMMGYLLVGVAAANEVGATGAIFHALVHAVMKTAAFIAITMVAVSLGKENIEYEDIAGLWKRAPLTSAAFTVAIISLGGIPPTAGFFSKFVLFLGAVEADLVWLALVAILNSVFSLGYYLNILKYVYLEDPTDDTKLAESKAPLVIIVIAAVLLVAMGIFSGQILDFIATAADTFHLD